VTVLSILREEQEWSELVEKLFGDAKLIAVSRHIGDSRVYQHDDAVAIIRRRGVKLPHGVHGLGYEARVLTHLGIPAEFREIGDWDALVTGYIAGDTLEQLAQSLSVGQRTRLALGIARLLRSLHLRGVAHRDLRPDNVIIDSDGRPALIDFDRARLTTPVQAAIADWVGVGADHLTYNPFWKFLLFMIAPKARTALMRVRARVTDPAKLLPDSFDDETLEALRAAWSLAQRSPSNAPGQGTAYYAFSYRGIHFPGERPWYLRWDAIKRNVDFRGKSLLELGCNLGLLSSFATLHGATEAVGVDMDPLILRASSLVATALGATARFEKADLDRDHWEERLGGRDIAAAMSVVHWLPDPGRVLKFLGGHPEIIYEGHDSLDIEHRRLQALGFFHSRVLMETERGRFLIHAWKNGNESRI
jgi:predicted Ser/Thr protein kinase